jgi:hypothetical protein
MTATHLTAPTDEAATKPARRFYRGMAIAFLVAIILGFGNSARQRAALGVSLPPYVVAHGILFAGWFVLFLVQTTLVAGSRLDLHRRLGYVLAGAAALMTVTGPWLAIVAARLGHLPGDPLAFMLIMIGDVVCFAPCIAAAIYFRNRAETHKRFMLLGTTTMVAPAVSRWPMVSGHPSAIVPVMIALLIAPLIYDRMARRPAHRVSVWGGIAVFASVPIRLAVAQTAAWHAVARWLIK